MDEVWYYEYTVEVFDEINRKEERRSGVVPAKSMSDAVAQLEKYYGCELMSLEMLKPITEGILFDFQEANNDSDFDYVISRKI